MENLSTYDIVVLEPQALGPNAKARIAALRATGTIVIGYMSFFEVAEWHRYRSRVNPEWTIRIDGKAWEPWGRNHAMTLASAGWRKMLCELLQSEVLDYGCDGVFMDTLADLDHPALPEEMRKLELEGLSALMKELRSRYPQTLLIPNWTIQKTLSVVSPYADAICWEDFSPLHFEDRETERWMRKNAERIGAERKKRIEPLLILTLWDAPGGMDAERKNELFGKMRAISASFGYLPYPLTGGYQQQPAVSCGL